MTKNKEFDWKITAKKVIFVTIEVLISGGIAYATKHPEALGLIPLFEGLRNIYKHFQWNQ